MLEIKEVKTKKQQKEFINFPLKLYKDNPYFVPPLYVDEMKLFKNSYVYYDQAKAVYYNAYKDGEMVGRISGILQKASNEKWNQKRVRFTRFDAIDDQEVATMLFEKIEKWALEEGMEEVVGPLGFSDLEREGLLIEGFDQMSTFEEQYNYPYYQKLIENCGYEKEVDWLESKLRNKEVIDERLERISSYMLKKNNLHLGQFKNTKQFLKKYSDSFFDVLDETYKDLYGTVPFTEGMKKMMISNFKLIINIKYVAAILDENENLVCFGLCFPSIGGAVKKSNGHLTPIAVARILHALKHPKVLDLALIGALPKYQMKGISTALIVEIMKMLQNPELDHAETNLNLETNYSILNQWKNFDAVQHKKRRSFIKKIS